MGAMLNLCLTVYTKINSFNVKGPILKVRNMVVIYKTHLCLVSFYRVIFSSMLGQKFCEGAEMQARNILL